MRKQEFNSKLISLLPLDEVPFTSTPSPPAPLAIRKAPSGRRRKSRRQSHKFFKHLLRLGTPTRRHTLGRLPTPPPLPENLLLGLHRKLPSAPPGSTQEVSESENRPATRGTAHSEVRGDARCTARPMAALHFLLPTGDSR